MGTTKPDPDRSQFFQRIVNGHALPNLKLCTLDGSLGMEQYCVLSYHNTRVILLTWSSS